MDSHQMNDITLSVLVVEWDDGDALFFVISAIEIKRENKLTNNESLIIGNDGEFVVDSK